MSDELPKGPCPDEDKLNAIVAKIINNDGAQNLTFKALRVRVEAEVKISMEEHRPAINKAAEKAVRAPRTLKKLQDFDIEKAAGLVSQGGKKKGGGRKSSGGTKVKREGSSSRKKSSSTRVKKEKKEDYDGPKKPLTAFFLYTNAVRAQLKEEHPDWGIGEFGKHNGEQWKLMSDEDKQKWNDKHDEAVVVYEAACKEYVAGGGVLKGRTGKVKKEKENKGPKRALSAYFCFLAAKRPELQAQGLGLTEIAKKGGELWGQLTDEEKKPYVAQQQEDVARYARECEEQGFDPKAASSSKKPKKKSSGAKRNRSSRKTGGSNSSVSSFSSSDSDSSSSSSSSGSSSSGSSSLSSDSSSISSDSADTPE